MKEIRERVIDLIVEETGIPRARVDTGSTLADDIGLEGDDAAEFFTKFGARFRVDLNALYDHWPLHFHPEGHGGPGLGCVVVAAVAGVAGYAVHAAWSRVPAWVSVPVIGGMTGWVYGRFLHRHFTDEPEPKIPIVVRELMEAADSGRWMKRYDDGGGVAERSEGGGGRPE